MIYFLNPSIKIERFLKMIPEELRLHLGVDSVSPQMINYFKTLAKQHAELEYEYDIIKNPSYYYSSIEERKLHIKQEYELIRNEALSKINEQYYENFKKEMKEINENLNKHLNETKNLLQREHDKKYSLQKTQLLQEQEKERLRVKSSKSVSSVMTGKIDSSLNAKEIDIIIPPDHLKREYEQAQKDYLEKLEKQKLKLHEEIELHENEMKLMGTYIDMKFSVSNNNNNNNITNVTTTNVINKNERKKRRTSSNVEQYLGGYNNNNNNNNKGQEGINKNVTNNSEVQLLRRKMNEMKEELEKEKKFKSTK